MNAWGWFVITLGLLAVVMAVRNSLANLAPLVPGSGGTLGGTGNTDTTTSTTTTTQLAAAGPGTGANSRTVDVGDVTSLPTPSPLFTAPRIVAA